ncbi:GNAT family N-acetyltransferase [Kitasatospora sp. NPDC056138]|uniref:GNAT family N-acetyltransferase n=1 Tax=Kitasatospora sp. NPDC056138 TaxID=3345724 RepID=UPI0035D8AA0A
MRGVTSYDRRQSASATVLDALEQYYDAVPRSSARVEDFGPLSLFVREGEGWPFYARPTLGGAGPVRADDVARVLSRQRELGAPESFEWVAETTPSLRAAAEACGLHVHAHPLMVLAPDAPTPRITAHADVTVRVLGPEDPALAAALAVPRLAFAEPGTRIGAAGPAELAEASRTAARDGSTERVAGRIRTGLTRVAVAVTDGTALCSGMHQPVGEVTEIVGVGTLPAARRRGLAHLVTAALVADARALGTRTVFLSAGDEDVARVYARLGFRPVGTALIAEPAA